MKQCICRTCGKSFVTDNCQPGHYCSLPCRDIGRRRREIRTCIYCGQQFEVIRSLPNKYCSHACASTASGIQSRKQYPIHICKCCGKQFEYRRTDGTGEYCSVECRAKHFKPARKAAWIVKACPECGKEFETPPYYNTTCCSRDCSNKHTAKWQVGKNHPLYKDKIEMVCEICGKVCQVKPSLASRFRVCSRRCAAILQQKTWPHISSIEVAMNVALVAVGLNPVSQYSVGPFLIDLALPEYHIAIECDGTYWHGNDKQQSKDRQKDGYLRRQGWQIVRLPEKDIKQDIDSCVKRITHLLPTP